MVRISARLGFALAFLVLAGCGSATQSKLESGTSGLRAGTEAMSAETHRIIVVRGSDIPGHPHYASLGQVQGYCRGNALGDDQVISGDSLRQAALRRFGARVDAIVYASGYFVNTDNGYTLGDPDAAPGYWICTGTAVTFADNAPSPSPAPQP